MQLLTEGNSQAWESNSELETTRSERPRRPTTQEQRLFGLFLQDAKAVPEEGPASALSLNQSPNL